MLSNWEEYNVNIDWLRTGNSEMFLPTETNTLEALRKEYNLTDQQFNFISNFLRLPENEKNIVFNFLSSNFNENFENRIAIEQRIQQELNEYREELELEARQTEKSSVLDTQNVELRKNA